MPRRDYQNIDPRSAAAGQSVRRQGPGADVASAPALQRQVPQLLPLPSGEADESADECDDRQLEELRQLEALTTAQHERRRSRAPAGGVMSAAEQRQQMQEASARHWTDRFPGSELHQDAAGGVVGRGSTAGAVPAATLRRQAPGDLRSWADWLSGRPEPPSDAAGGAMAAPAAADAAAGSAANNPGSLQSQLPFLQRLQQLAAQHRGLTVGPWAAAAARDRAATAAGEDGQSASDDAEQEDAATAMQALLAELDELAPAAQPPASPLAWPAGGSAGTASAGSVGAMSAIAAVPPAGGPWEDVAEWRAIAEDLDQALGPFGQAPGEARRGQATHGLAPFSRARIFNVPRGAWAGTSQSN